MSLVEKWRQFHFFDKLAVCEPAAEAAGDAAQKICLFKGLNITSWACGADFTLFGDPNGAVLRLDRHYCIQIFKPHEKRLVDFVLAGHTLVTVGDDEPGGAPTLKLWDVSAWEEGSSPPCKLASRLQLGAKKAPQLSAVAVTPALDFIAVGLTDTSVFYSHGDVRRGPPKWRPLRDGASALGSGSLVGLAAKNANDGRVVVFAVTSNSLRSYVLKAGAVVRETNHDAKGCEPNCWHYAEEKRQLVVAGREMVYFYELDACLEAGSEQGRCQALARGDTTKLQLLALGSYVFIVTQEQAAIQ